MGYAVFRGKGTADSRYKMVVASLFSAPLLIGFLIWINLQLADRLKIDTSAANDYILLFGIYSTIIILSPLGWVQYALTATFVVFAWLAKPEPRSHKFLLAFYLGLLFLYVGYNAWWYLTKQQMTSP
jgi:hypothetical protein